MPGCGRWFSARLGKWLGRRCQVEVIFKSENGTGSVGTESGAVCGEISGKPCGAAAATGFTYNLSSLST